jgi:hypothetical protein
MARIIRTKDKDHRLTISADHGDGGQVLVVRGGGEAYLWAGRPTGHVITVSGVTVLRKLARAILAEVGKG